MRKFSNNEKKIIRKIVELGETPRSSFPINILDINFISQNMTFDGSNPDAPKLSFFRPKNFATSAIQLVDVYHDLYEKVMVIDYLAKEGLIKPVLVGHEQSYNVIEKNTNYVRIDLPIDKDVSQTLMMCINAYIYVSETLKDFVRNNFKSIEDQALEEARKQTQSSKKSVFFALWSVIIAFMTLLATIFQDDIKAILHSNSAKATTCTIENKPTWERNTSITTITSNQKKIIAYKKIGFFLNNEK